MKPITGPAQAAAIQALGHEPILIVKIEWGGSIGTRYYGPKDLTVGSVTAAGKLLEVGPISSQKKQDNVGMVSTVSITMDDLDGQLKVAVDAVSVEYTTATIYQFFQGLSEADLMQIYKGQVVGPIEWSEGKRTLHFDIETRLRDLEVGFSADLGSIPYLNPDAVDKAWPLAFGSVVHSPALKLITPPLGRLKYPFKGPRDPTQPLTSDPYFDDRQFTLQDGDGVYFPQTTPVQVQIEGVIFLGTFAGDVFTVIEANMPKYENVDFGLRGANVPAIIGAPTDPDIDTAYVAWLQSPLSIVNNYIYIQTPSGSYYLRVVRQENNKIWMSDKVSSIDPDGLEGSGSYHLFNIGESISQVAKNGRPGWALTMSSPGNALPQAVAVIGRVDWSFQADAEVSLWQPEHKDVYVANLIPTTTIRGVHAEKKIKDGGTELVPIPLGYYTINLNDSIVVANVSGTVTVHPTTLTFETGLRDYIGQGWSDAVYVTLESTVGPNTADIISWMYENYSSLEVDDASFDAVHDLIDNAPSSFTRFDKENVQSLAEKVAWQAMCGLVVDNGTVFLKYLALEPDVDVTIGESGTQLKTITLGYTKIEEIITRFRATYKLTYFPAKRFEKELNYANNIAKYGLRKRDYDFFIYNIPELVQKSVNFWGFRYSNSWRLVKLTTLLEGLRLEIFDCVYLAYSDTGLLNTAGVKSIVDRHTYDANTDEIVLDLWLPCLAGTTVVSSKAWVDYTGDATPTDPSLRYVPTIRDFQLADDESKFRTVTSKQIGGSAPGIITADVAPVGSSTDSDNADSTSSPMVATVYGNGFGSPPTQVGLIATPVDPASRPTVGQRVTVYTDNNKSYISNASAGSPGLQEFDAVDLEGYAELPSPIPAHVYGELPTNAARLIQFAAQYAWDYVTKKLGQVAGTFGPIGGWFWWPGKAPRLFAQWSQVVPVQIVDTMRNAQPLLKSDLTPDTGLNTVTVSSITGATPAMGDVGLVVRGTGHGSQELIFIPIKSTIANNYQKVCKVIVVGPFFGWVVQEYDNPTGGGVSIGPPFAAYEYNGQTPAIGSFVNVGFSADGTPVFQKTQ